MASVSAVQPQTAGAGVSAVQPQKAGTGSTSIHRAETMADPDLLALFLVRFQNWAAEEFCAVFCRDDVSDIAEVLHALGTDEDDGFALLTVRATKRILERLMRVPMNCQVGYSSKGCVHYFYFLKKTIAMNTSRFLYATPVDFCVVLPSPPVDLYV